ncbi:MAG: dicarboxylate/amino acid:cation symporter [Gammaproteobacteria bacterium]|nr:dicarboxylate/amino acid:cation symporter [Gammaproteobacteria bacterium]
MQHNNKLLWAILIGALAGIFSGWFFGHAMQSVAWVGKLFLNLLMLTIIPLIVAAVITGITSLGDVRKLGKLGGFTVLYYLSTTAIAVLVGLVIVNIIQPGIGISELSDIIPDKVLGNEKTGIEDIVDSLIKPNLVAAAAESQLLPIILFCLAFATALTTIGDKGKTVIHFFEGLNDVMMKLVIWIMYLSPIGIFALIASKLGATGGGEAFWQEMSSVGWYILTVIIGLAIHAIILLIILMTFSRRGRDYVINMLRALLMAFGTASSAATLPLTMECAIEAKVDKRAVKFVLPLGATINMDGTALYEAVAVMFIAQAYGFDLGVTQQAIIFVTATFAAIGAAAIPSAGLVTMIIVLTAVGLPIEGIGLLLAIDWFLDRIRTTVNVWGDSVGAAVIERLLIDSNQSVTSKSS